MGNLCTQLNCRNKVAPLESALRAAEHSICGEKETITLKNRTISGQEATILSQEREISSQKKIMASQDAEIQELKSRVYTGLNSIADVEKDSIWIVRAQIMEK